MCAKEVTSAIQPLFTNFQTGLGNHLVFLVSSESSSCTKPASWTLLDSPCLDESLRIFASSSALFQVTIMLLLNQSQFITIIIQLKRTGIENTTLMKRPWESKYCCRLNDCQCSAAYSLMNSEDRTVRRSKTKRTA